MRNCSLTHQARKVFRDAGIKDDLIVRTPCAADVLYLINSGEETHESLSYFNLGTEIACLLVHQDKSRLTSTELDKILHHSAAFEAVMTIRSRLYGCEIDHGHIVVACPACQAHEKKLSLLEAALVLSAGIDSPLQENGILLREPKQATFIEHPLRPPFSGYVSRVTVCTDNGQRKRLRRVQAPELEAARSRFEVDELNPPEGKEDWVYRLPGFRAVLQLSLALTEYGTDLSEGQLQATEKLPFPDFLLLDAAFQLVFASAVDLDSASPLICTECAKPFLPAAL